MAPARIVVCTTPADVQRALQNAVHDGVRPTVRSGGHCYENFTANNPGGVLLDLSLLNTVDFDSSTGEYCVAPGAVLGDVYQSLYKQYGLTLPAGSCYSVGAGGHISGGGYGCPVTPARAHLRLVDGRRYSDGRCRGPGGGTSRRSKERFGFISLPAVGQGSRLWHSSPPSASNICRLLHAKWSRSSPFSMGDHD